MIKCKVDNCENEKIAAKGYCWKHYARLRRTGTLDITEQVENKDCSVDGCNKKARSKGLCKNHYYRLLKYGDATTQIYEDNCTMRGCNEDVKAKGLCKNHYANYIYRKKANNTLTVEEYKKSK